MSGRKSILIVDDDPGMLYVLASGLSNVLDTFDVVTAENGREAIERLEERAIDVLVTDLAMPVMDGFSLIAYLTNQRATLPIVVLSGMAPDSVDERLAGFGGLRVLRKPTSYQELAKCVLEEIERVDLGQVEGIPLAGVLQLVEAERRSCSVVVTSGKRRGRLQFESGRLVNAFSDDFGAEGEAAAYDILSWNHTVIGFEQLPTHVRKLIRTPMQLMLIELAVAQDEVRLRPIGTGGNDAVAVVGSGSEPTTDTSDHGRGGDAADRSPDTETPSDEVPADHLAANREMDPDGVADPAAAALPSTDADAGAGPVPSRPTRGDLLVEAVADSDRAASHAEASVQKGPETAAVAEATERATTGNGEAMRIDPTDDPLPSDPGPSAPATSAAPAAPVTVADEGVRDAGPGGDARAAEPPPPLGAAHPAAHRADDEHVTEMVAAVERLAQRARAADEALLAVVAEVEAFRAAQRRFDEVHARRELRRRELEAFRDDVARLAREILGRVDGLFDAMSASDAAAGSNGQPPT